MNSNICEIQVINNETVEAVRKMLPAEKTLDKLSDYFKYLGDPTRLRIVASLMSGKLCVCDIACITEVSVSAISHQLRYLKTAGILESQKKGKMVYYSIRHELISQLMLQALKYEYENE